MHAGLTKNALSSSIYRRYWAIASHWIDNKCKLREAVISFHRFPVPHSDTATDLFLHEQIEKCSLGSKIMSANTDNASGMKNSISQIHALLNNSYPSSSSTVSLFHGRCFARVIKLAVKEGIKITHSDIDEVGSMINLVRASTKLRAYFKAMVWKVVSSDTMPEAVHQPIYNIEMR